MDFECKSNNDLFQTSTGVGHHWRDGLYFPSSNFERTILKPLPPNLVKSNEITQDDHYVTTNKNFYDRKYILPYNNPDIHVKPPSLRNVHYNLSLHEKLNHAGTRRELTMGNQTSEVHENFRGQYPISSPMKFKKLPGFSIKDHMDLELGHGCAKPLSSIFMDDRFWTTNKIVHRPFSCSDLNGVAKKDAATFWECENYPKAWGHGGKLNPLPDIKPPREEPMIDHMIFKSKTTIPRVAPALKTLPHSGMKSEYGDRYQEPSDVKSKEANFCPVDPPYFLPPPASKAVYSVPQMYNTEYNNFGSKVPAIV